MVRHVGHEEERVGVKLGGVVTNLRQRHGEGGGGIRGRMGGGGQICNLLRSGLTHQVRSERGSAGPRDSAGINSNAARLNRAHDCGREYLNSTSAVAALMSRLSSHDSMFMKRTAAPKSPPCSASVSGLLAQMPVKEMHLTPT